MKTKKKRVMGFIWALDLGFILSYSTLMGLQSMNQDLAQTKSIGLVIALLFVVHL